MKTLVTAILALAAGPAFSVSDPCPLPWITCDVEAVRIPEPVEPPDHQAGYLWGDNVEQPKELEDDTIAG